MATITHQRDSMSETPLADLIPFLRVGEGEVYPEGVSYKHFMVAGKGGWTIICFRQGDTIAKVCVDHRTGETGLSYQIGNTVGACNLSDLRDVVTDEPTPDGGDDFPS